MILVTDSLTIVILGDWNRFYLQPDWIANNVYEKQEIELGVNGHGTEFSVTYRCNGVLISPSQSQIIFTATKTDNLTIEKLVTCANNFLLKAITPDLKAYGYNCEYVESNSSQFADLIDKMNDNDKI